VDVEVGHILHLGLFPVYKNNQSLFKKILEQMENNSRSPFIAGKGVLAGAGLFIDMQKC
jgi:hypothetical protein